MPYLEMSATHDLRPGLVYTLPYPTLFNPILPCAAEVSRAEQPEAVREALVPALLGGAASHHAGALPAWKALVEGLFQRGLLKVAAPVRGLG